MMFQQQLAHDSPEIYIPVILSLKALPVDPSGRVSIGDLATTLESSILTEGKKQNGMA